MPKINQIIQYPFNSVIQDKIAEILVDEYQNQLTLALAEDEDDFDYDIDFYYERFTPYSDEEPKPVLNLFYTDSLSVRFNPQTRIYTSTFHVEHFCKMPESEIGNNQRGDELSSRLLKKLLFTTEAIFMASQYTDLDLPQLVRSKKVTSITSSPTDRGMSTGNEIAGRVVIEVEHPEQGFYENGTVITGSDLRIRKTPSEYGIKIEL